MKSNRIAKPISAAQQAKIAETNFNKLSKEAAEATLASDASTFAERNRARIILKRLAKGKKLKAVA